jgi:hypothetical protein
MEAEIGHPTQETVDQFERIAPVEVLGAPAMGETAA